MKTLLLKIGLIGGIMLGFASIINSQTFSPEINETNVSTNPILSITFDNATNVSLNTGFGGGDIAIALPDLSWTSEINDFTSVSGNSINIDLTNHPSLDFSTEYVIITSQSDVINVDGEPWSDLIFNGENHPYWTFMTEAEPLPVTASFNPSIQALDVSINPTLSITFDNATSVSLNTGFGGGDIAIALPDLSWTSEINDFTSVSGNSINIDLTSHPSLDFSTEYVIITSQSDVINVDGEPWSDLIFNGEDHPYWTFMTEAEPLPVTASFNPSIQALDVSINPTLSITFDNATNVSLNTGFGAGDIAIALPDLSWTSEINDFTSVSGNSINIDLTSHPSLDFSTEYVIITSQSDVINVDGEPWSDLIFNGENHPYWTFTTEAEPITLTSITPADEATNVAVDTDLTITFSENISRGSGNLTIYNSGGDFQTIPASSTTYLSLSDNQLTITHNTFSESTDYYVLMDNGFISGFSGISDPDTWNFTTSAGAPVWTTTPSLSNQSPSEVTLSGRADQNGTFYFAILNSIDPAPSKEDIKSGATATIHGSGTLTANQPFSQTIDITSLTAGNVYTLYIIADNGSSYSDPVVSRNIDLVAPDLNSVNPSNGTTDVDINATITLTYSKPIFGTGGVILDNSNIGDYIKLQTGTVPTDVPFTIEFNNTGNILTLTPDAYLDDNTAYTLNFVTELEDQNGNVQSELSTNRTFTTENVIFWMGGTTDWNTNTNWEDNTLPDDHSILIPAGLTDYPEINSGSASLNNVYIEAGASLINTGASINVSGQFVLQSSDVANAAYVPQGGTLTVTDLSKVRIEQIISDPTDVYYISAPVTGATKGNTGITDAVVYYDNTTDAYIYLNNDADALEHGRGYVVRNPGDIAFTGSIFQEDLSTEVIRTAGQGLGWNLIGNPYTASIDLNLLTLNNVDNTFWIYRNDPGLYGTYNTTGVSVNLDPENPEILPSNTSFWVRVNKDFTSGTVGFTRTNTRGNPHTYLKSTSSGFQYPLLKLATNFNGIKDETALVQIPEASTGYDNYDSDKKLSGKSHICDFYSTAGTSKLAINSVPSLEEGVSINLGFVQNTAIMENCKIAMVNNTLPSNISVLLEDKVENTMTDITNGTPYSFSSDKRGKTENRFVIHFAGSVATNTTEAEVSKNNEKIQIFTNKSEIIAYLGQLNKPEFQLFDINGRLLKNGTLNAGSRNVISVNHNGSIVLVITHSEGIKTFKTVS